MTNWQIFLPTLALSMVRPFAMMLLLPIFSSRALGSTLARNALVLVMALPVIPLLLNAPPVPPSATAFDFACVAIREVVIGLLLGFCAAIPFWAIDMAGFLIDTIRGSSMASALNPMLGEQSSVFGMLFSRILVALFFVSGGFEGLLKALYSSYVALPPSSSILFAQTFEGFIAGQWQAMLTMCVGFAMPSIAVMVLVDVGLGLVNRSAQQLNVFFIAMPIKSALCLFVLAIGLSFSLSSFVARFMSFGDIVNMLFEVIK